MQALQGFFYPAKVGMAILQKVYVPEVKLKSSTGARKKAKLKTLC